MYNICLCFEWPRNVFRLNWTEKWELFFQGYIQKRHIWHQCFCTSFVYLWTEILSPYAKTMHKHAQEFGIMTSEYLCPFVSWMHWWLVDSPHKEPVMQKVFPCHEVIMIACELQYMYAVLMYKNVNWWYIFAFVQNTAPVWRVKITLDPTVKSLI